MSGSNHEDSETELDSDELDYGLIVSEHPPLISFEGEKRKKWRKLRRWWRKAQSDGAKKKIKKVGCPCEKTKKASVAIMVISSLEAIFATSVWIFGWLPFVYVTASAVSICIFFCVMVALVSGNGVETSPHISTCFHQKSFGLASRR